MAFLCTEENPWSVGKETPVRHSRVREVGDQRDNWPAGDLVTMECLNCGHRWETELPQ